MGLSFVEQEYRNRKLTRLRKRIEEHLRSAALPPSESAFGGQSSSSDLSELLQTFRCSAPSDSIMTKGTHFTHTQKFTFTRVSSSLKFKNKIIVWHKINVSLFQCVIVCVHVFALFLCHKQDTAPVISTISIGHKSESDAQVQQQEVLESLQQQVEQLSNDVDQMTADIKQISVTYTQVTHMQN